MKKYLSLILLFSGALFGQQVDASSLLEEERSTNSVSAAEISDEDVDLFLNELNGYASIALQEEGELLNHSQLDFIQTLIDIGYEGLEALSSDGVHSLHLAAADGSPDMINLILASVKDKNVTDPSGNTAVHYALKNKNAVSLGLMYANNLDFFQANDDGVVPFEEIRGVLAQATALKEDENPLCEHTDDPLLLAAYVHVGGDSHFLNDKLETFAMCFVKALRANPELPAKNEILWLLMKLDVDFFIKDSEGNCAGCMLLSIETDEILLNDELALHEAILEENYNRLKFLMSSNHLDLTKQDAEGNTPAHLAAQKLDLELLDLLFTSEVAVIKNNAGRDIFDELVFAHEQKEKENSKPKEVEFSDEELVSESEDQYELEERGNWFSRHVLSWFSFEKDEL